MKRMRMFKALFMLCLFMMIGVLASDKVEAQDNFRISHVDVSKFPEITVYFDMEGGNLTKSGFTIYDLDGNVIPIKKFMKNNKFGKNVSSLMIDTSGSMDGDKLNQAKNISKQFVTDILKHKNNKMDLYEFNAEASRRGTFFDSRETLKSVIDQFKAYGGTAIYDTVKEGIYAISGQSGAKSIIVVTDGRDENSDVSIDEVRDLALQKTIPVYIVKIGGYDSTLANFSEATGGKFYAGDQGNIKRNLRNIFDLGKKRMSLTFVSKNKSRKADDYLKIVYAENGKNLSTEYYFSSDIKDIPLQNRIIKITSSGAKAPETVRKESRTYYYHPIYAFDGTAKSPWVGDKKKNWLKVEFGGNEKIDSIFIRNGYWYMSNGNNRLEQNSRPKKIRITTDKGYQKTFTLKDPAKQMPSNIDGDGKANTLGQKLRIGTRAKWVKFEILSVYKGTKWEKDICISDILFK